MRTCRFVESYAARRDQAWQIDVIALGVFLFLAGLASTESPLLGIFLIATGVFALALALWEFRARR